MGKMKILLIDDEDELVFTLAERLELRGYTVDAFTSGADAMVKIKENKYDVAVVDVKMPGMDGMAVLKQIKIDAPKVPVILLTGHGDAGGGSEGLRSGAKSYLLKPINIDELIQEMTKAVNKND